MLKKIIILMLSILLISGCNHSVEKASKRKDINNLNMEVNQMKVIINNSEYVANLENNETVQEFLKLLPKEFNMNELNGNEKYIYLDTKLSSNPHNVKEIKKGDIMLYGNNCIVIFYESFTTSYAYTKIGHIDNLPNLGSGNIVVKFEK